MKSIGIHIFRKDLRLIDNLALNDLSKEVDIIIPLFILDQSQIVKTNANKYYFSYRAARFILDSLIELNKLCDNKLCIMYGNPINILQKIFKIFKPNAISFNADYSSYALDRDSQIIKLCDKIKIKCIINYDDQSLIRMETMIKSDGMPYMVYGPFYKNSSKHIVAQPKTNKIFLTKATWNGSMPISDKFIQKEYQDKSNYFIGGRSYGLSNMRNKNSIKGFENRDLLANKSFEISPYLNFGCISIREVYHYFKNQKIKAIRELYWRDFFLCILRYKPNANNHSQPMDKLFNKIKWRKVNTKQAIAEWNNFMNCSTGYLLIDAGMKQLQSTGYIGNRMRLLLATFWTKYLMINNFDLEYGAQSGYSRYLTDCNTSQNKLNHQWITSELDLSGRRFAKKGTNPLTGRTIRIDNDMIKKYDPNLIYISTWLVEWKGKTKKDIKSVQPIFEWKERYEEYCNRFN